MIVIGTYDPYLVTLSFAVAWLATAAIAMGGGIWSMHFIAMLAFFMPMPVSYDLGLTVLSLVVAIGVTGFGFFTIGTRQETVLGFILSGIFMGIGIVSMH